MDREHNLARIADLSREGRSRPSGGQLVIGALWVSGAVSTAVAIPVGVLALMLLPAAFTGACSIYYSLGISTLPRRKR